MARQNGFAAVVEIKPGLVGALRQLLAQVGADVGHSVIPFYKLTRVHFLRWFVLEASQDADGVFIPAYLVLSTNFDEPEGEHLCEFVQVCGETFDRIYHHCLGYDAKGDRVKFLRAHRADYTAFYVGTRGRSVDQIRKEERLRGAIQAYLNTIETVGVSATTVRRRIQDHIQSKPEFAWVRAEPAGQAPRPWTWNTLKYLGIALLVAGVAVWLVSWLTFRVPWWLVPALVIGPAIAFVILLLWYEKREPVEDVSDPIEDVATLQSREDHVVQNQLTNVVLLKPGWFRRGTVVLALSAIHFLGRVMFVRGALGGIPTIHFARWVRLDRGRRLLFLSNFDGSWENYLGDFIDKAAVGLTAIWSNTIGCPRARWLVKGGAADERAFKTWVRRNQVSTPVWYSAYRNLTVENINNNTNIRLGLFGNLTDEATRAWLDLL